MMSAINVYERVHERECVSEEERGVRKRKREKECVGQSACVCGVLLCVCTSRYICVSRACRDHGTRESTYIKFGTTHTHTHVHTYIKFGTNTI